MYIFHHYSDQQLLEELIFVRIHAVKTNKKNKNLYYLLFVLLCCLWDHLHHLLSNILVSIYCILKNRKSIRCRAPRLFIYSSLITHTFNKSLWFHIPQMAPSVWFFKPPGGETKISQVKLKEHLYCIQIILMEPNFIFSEPQTFLVQYHCFN